MDLPPLRCGTPNSQGIHRDKPITQLDPAVIISSSSTAIICEETRLRSMAMCLLLGVQFGDNQEPVSTTSYLGDARLSVRSPDFH